MEKGSREGSFEDYNTKSKDLGKTAPGKGNSQCKIPRARAHLAYL